ncbi:MAG: hypothetical protein ABIQ77_06700 [Anaerolineales bacterium]
MISKSQLKTSLTILLFVMFIGQGCGGIASPAPSLAVPAVTETVTRTATNTSEPTNTQIPPQFIEPLVASPRLRVDSWSPDSQWIAYWFAEGDDGPAHLAFMNVQSGKVCQHEEVNADDIFSGLVIWVEDNDAITVQNSGKAAFSGVLCGVFSSTEILTTSEKEEGQISPDGRYRVDTSISGWEGELIHNVTTITEISTTQLSLSVKWDGSPHAWAESGWLNNELYMIGLDVNRGALYISVPSGTIGNVVSDLLGLDVQEVGNIFHVARHTNPATGDYHLLLEMWKGPPGSPLLLYHSELDLVEEIPFYRSWIVNGSTISSDGKWLFIGYPSSKSNDETTDFWIRSLDPPDSAALQLAEGMGFAGFSTEAQKIAFVDNKYVYILNFPNGEMLNQWGAPGYQIDRVWWSPDGSRLAMQGFPTGSKPEALFVVEP